MEYLDYLTLALFVFLIGTMGYRAWRAAKELKERALPLRPMIPADALFGETRASGHVVRGGLSAFSGASNCLLVWVTRSEFVVDVFFPVNLLVHDMHNVPRVRVPVKRITSARLANERAVVIAFNDADAKPLSIRLALRNPRDLISALKSLKVRVIEAEREPR